MNVDALLALPNTVKPLRIAPTDVSQFIRLEQCERYLRLRLVEQNGGRSVLRAYDVQPQSIPPLLTRSGRQFEEEVESAIAARHKVVRCSLEARASRNVLDDTELVRNVVTELPPNGSLVLLQPAMAADLADWSLRGVADCLLFDRADDGHLRLSIIDFKSSAESKIEHWLQLAFYRSMLEPVVTPAGVSFDITLGVLYRGSTVDTTDGASKDADRRRTAESVLGVSTAYLHLLDDDDPYRRAAADLVLRHGSLAERVASAPFDDLRFHLTYKCDGCLYNQFCLKRSAERDDPSLVPHLSETDKLGLRRAGVETVRALAELPNETPMEGAETTGRRLARNARIGPRLGELVERARRYRAFKGDAWAVSSRLSGARQASLPQCAADHDPNLVLVYVDVQHDYVSDRLYLLGSRIVAYRDGAESRERIRTIVELARGPVEDDVAEAALLTDWIDRTLGAIADLAQLDEDGNPKAPIHLVFYDRYDQRTLLDALGRHTETVFAATPLYDLVAQMPAFDSPVITFLVDEIKTLRNYPMLCQSLQSVASFLRFDWGADPPLRTIFRERFFDAAGRLSSSAVVEGETSPWYTARARFSSQIPLEYAYAAWNALEAGGGDEREREPYRGATADAIGALQAKRLEAMAWIAKDLPRNTRAFKARFDLSRLKQFSEVAPTLAHALDQFIVIERHADLAAWKAQRLPEPEQRVLAGTSMIVRYLESDQDAVTRDQNRANQRSEAFRQAAKQEGRKLSADERKAHATDYGDLALRMRIDLSNVDCDLKHALDVWDTSDGKSVIFRERWTVDERPEATNRDPFTPTPRQLLYGAGARVQRVEIARDDRGEIAQAWVWLAMTSGGGSQPGFTFAHYPRSVTDGELYTIEEDPNSFVDGWQKRLTEQLAAGEEHEVYARLAAVSSERLARDLRVDQGLQRFLDGLSALHELGWLPAFEPGKQRLIGGMADAPIILVQGPPGTGKSFTTAYAILARLQAALDADRTCRVLMSCKTHAAVDVLLKNVVEAVEQLRQCALLDRAVFDRYFDERLLSVATFRVAPKDHALPGVVGLDRPRKGDAVALDRLRGQRVCVVAATPGGIRNLQTRWGSAIEGACQERWANLVVLDEASQMGLPEALLATMPLESTGQLIVVGDHRQMPPIVKHEWGQEAHRSFKRFRAYESLFLTLKEIVPEEDQIKFVESFRVHADIAAFLRREIYRFDGIPYFSSRVTQLEPISSGDAFVHAALGPSHPLVVIVHDEAGSEQRNGFEQRVMAPILEAMAGELKLDPGTGLGVVVPHRAQRQALRDGVPCLSERDPITGLVLRSSVDTVERFQGGERRAIVVGATESDRQYVLQRSSFLLDPRRLNVAVSRAQDKLILIASRTIFELFSADEEVFPNLQIWKNLLERTCTELLWQGTREGHQIAVWGNVPDQDPADHTS